MRVQIVRSRWLATSVLLTGVAGVAPAFAQGEIAPSTATKATPAVRTTGTAANEDVGKEAARLYEDGVKEAKAGSWEKARVAMLAAFKLKPSYAWAANLGKVEMRAAKPRDAAEHLSFFLREATKIEPEDRAAV